MVDRLPSGTVTLLFTDIEGSSRLWDAHGEAMAHSLTIHNGLVQGAIADNNGVVVKDKGDGVFAVFAAAPDALRAAVAAQAALESADWPQPVGPLRVRMALHSGTIEARDGDYHGPAVNRVARIESLAHGGQVLISEATRAIARDDLPQGVSIRDLGLQRLRGLERPERVYQLDAPGRQADFAPLRSETFVGVPLPVFPTSFVGRTAELEEIMSLLDGNGHRLVTLLGPGGIGKTRLAIETGRRIAEQLPGGGAFVDLAKVATNDDVALAIAQAVGAHNEGTASPVALAAAKITEPTLLVIDNFEHVQAASPMVAELLADTPHARCIATSRAPLRVQGERLYNVMPLGGSSDWSAAMELFYERAAGYGVIIPRSGREEDIVRSICRRLDGLPLAIELVAARTRLLGVVELEERLSRSLDALGTGAADLPERQRTVRSTIDWSLQSITEHQRTLFEQLAIFPAGATLDAIEQVCREVGDVIDAIAALVDNSLVTVVRGQPGGTRYRQLAPLREYALELLGPDTDPAMGRLVDHYVATSTELGRRLEFGRDAEQELTSDHGNLLAAMRWSLDHDRIVDMAQVIANVWLYWFNGDLAKPAADWTLRADTMATSADLDWLRGFFGFQTGDFETAATRTLRAVAVLGASGDGYRTAMAKTFAGMLSEDNEEGRTLLEDADGFLSDPRYGLSRFVSTIFLSFNAMRRGDLVTAIELRRQLLARAATLDHEMIIAWAHENLAAALFAAGNLEEAWTHNRAAFDVLVEEGSIEGVASVAEIEAVIDYADGRTERALWLLGATEPIWETLGTVRWPEAEFHIQTMLADASARLGDAAVASLIAEGRSATLQDLVEALADEPYRRTGTDSARDAG